MLRARIKPRSRWIPSSASRKQFSINPSSNLILNIPKADVYCFGDPNNTTPFFRNLEWSVKEGESWAVVGSGGGKKNVLFQMLLGHLRIKPHPPPPGGLFPFLSESNPPLDPVKVISIVSFSHRRASGSGFYDYTARYGAVHEEDRLTLRQNMFLETIPPLRMLYEDENSADTGSGEEAMLLSDEDRKIFEDLVDSMGLRQFLDLPLIALSNGQTRRARILKAILKKPEVLLLDEPLTGLDARTRPLLLGTLHTLHSMRSPRMIIGLRSQDTLPEWITHVAFVHGSKVTTGEKQGVLAEMERHRARSRTVQVPSEIDSIGSTGVKERRTKIGGVVVDLKNVKVQYHDRKVLDGITWQIRKGERWHLQGENGSGKTTLLSLITGDHPQSYTQVRIAPSASDTSSKSTTLSHLHLFSQPRNRLPTPLLHSYIGLLSPELFDAFPRRGDMSVFEAIGTGFEGGFVPGGSRGVGTGSIRVGQRILPQELTKPRTDKDEVTWEEEEEWRVKRAWEVLDALGPEAWKRARDELEGSPTSSATSQPEPNSSRARLPRSCLPLPSTKPTASASEPSPILQAFASTPFASLPTAHQRIVLLARALVSRAPLILLDEVWSGMDEAMVRAARAYLRADDQSEKREAGVSAGGGVREDQAVVVISHWEEEVPWGVEDNVYVKSKAVEGAETEVAEAGPYGLFRKFRLIAGRGSVEE